MSSEEDNDVISESLSSGEDLDIDCPKSISSHSDDQNLDRYDPYAQRVRGEEDEQSQQDNQSAEEESENEEYDLFKPEKPEKVLKSVKVEDDDRINNNAMTKYEYTKIIGLRAKQINHCSAIYVYLDEEERSKLNSMQIAEKEVKEKSVPFIIRRNYPNNEYEIWKVREMIGHKEVYETNI